MSGAADRRILEDIMGICNSILWASHVSGLFPGDLLVTPHIPSRSIKRIDKIRLLFNHLLAKFQEHFYPYTNISVDETMVGFRGRFGSNQYTPHKPVKWGIKAFTEADAKTGYMLNILVYMGAETLDDADTQFSSLPVLC